MVKKKNNLFGDKPKQLDISGDDPLRILLQHVALELERGNDLEAMRLITEGQAHHILAGTSNLPRQLVDFMGKKMTNKLITAFVHHSCPFCKKGRQKCENCDGNGHIDHEMVCIDCFSFGLVKCNFCDGSGWSSIDSIPAGLRPLVLYQRTKAAIARTKKMLSKPMSDVSKRKPIIILERYAQTLMEINRYLGVMENTLLAKDELIKSRFCSESKTRKIVASCIRNACNAKKRAREIVEYMAKTTQSQAKNADQKSDAQKLATARAEFYKSMLDSSNIFAGTNLEHPFLDEAIEKTVAKSATSEKR